jgi:hypothetical protein
MRNKMVDYYIRIKSIYTDDLYDFCKRHSITHSFRFEGVGSKPTELYYATMTEKDAMALKLSIPVNIMEKFNG